jgi:hypothetical protein
VLEVRIQGNRRRWSPELSFGQGSARGGRHVARSATTPAPRISRPGARRRGAGGVVVESAARRPTNRDLVGDDRRPSAGQCGGRPRACSPGPRPWANRVWALGRNP